jgi:valacyclovir hydrolase
MTRKTVRIDENVHLSYLDLGPADGQPLLLIHGFTGTARGDLGDLIDDFAAGDRVIAPDLRGFGASRPPNRDFSPDFYERDAADLAALLDQLALGPVTVLGFSDGAEASLLLAAARPDLVRGVIAWGVSGVISPEELAAVERWLPVSAWGPERETWKRQIIERHGAEQLESLVEGWVGAARAISARGGNICYEQAALIECPVLLLNGDGEVGNTPRDVRRLAERIPGARLVFVADSSHAIHRDQPATLLHHIRRFLAEREGAARVSTDFTDYRV